MNRARAAARAILPRSDHKPRPLPYAISLYRGDTLFRGLVDLAAVALIAILFTADLPSFPDVFAWFNHPQQGAGSTIGKVNWADNTGLGRVSFDYGILPPKIALDPATVEQAGPTLTPALRDVNQRLAAEDFDGAQQILDKLNGDDPTVAYASAVVMLRQITLPQLPMILRRLRVATDHAVPAAFTLTGDTKFGVASLYYRHIVPKKALVTLDGSGQAVPQEPDEMVREALDWWRRASAMGQVAAKRNLGMAAALGATGEPDYAAAAAFWREAAGLGDGLSSFELGMMYLAGVGVAPDSDKAEGLFEKASGQNFPKADLALAAALMPRVKKGEAGAVRMALAALDRAANSDASLNDRAFAHQLAGEYLIEVVPPALRDPQAGVEHFRQEWALGSAQGAFALGVSYHLGVGVEKNDVLAHAYLSVAKETFPSKTRKLLNEIEATLTPAELEQAKDAAAGLPRPSPFAAIDVGVPGDAGKPVRTERPLTPTLDDGFRSNVVRLKSADDLRKERSQ